MGPDVCRYIYHRRIILGWVDTSNSCIYIRFSLCEQLLSTGLRVSELLYKLLSSNLISTAAQRIYLDQEVMVVHFAWMWTYSSIWNWTRHHVMATLVSHFLHYIWIQIKIMPSGLSINCKHSSCTKTKYCNRMHWWVERCVLPMWKFWVQFPPSDSNKRIKVSN